MGRSLNATPSRVFVPKYVGVGEHGNPCAEVDYNDKQGTRHTATLIFDVTDNGLEVSVNAGKVKDTKFRNKKRARKTS